MFTGIVEELGEVVRLERRGDSAVLRVRGPLVTQDAEPGTSIAVDGCCLTVLATDPASASGAGEFAVDVMRETLDRTTIGALRPGDRVDLERAVRLDGRLDGHLVQGHVDGVGRIVERLPGERWELVTIAVPARLARYIAEKGSIAVDGVSLTVVEVLDRSGPLGPLGPLDSSGPLDGGETRFRVALIPTTLERTTLGLEPVGAPVNVEVDVLAKYVERLLTGTAHGGSGVRDQRTDGQPDGQKAQVSA